MVLPQISIDIMEAYTALKPLGLFVIGTTFYGVFVFHFYRFLARKDIFELDLSKHNQARRPALRKTITVVFYVFKSLLLFPLFVFFWFLVMAGLLFLMGRNQSIDNVMLAAMGVVAAIRICSYYNSVLSTDIAKILPFALLGIMLIDNSLLRLPQTTDGIREAALRWETMIYYLGAVVTLEFVLRIASGVWGLLRRMVARKAEPQVESTGSKDDVAGPDRPDVPVDLPAHDRRSELGPDVLRVPATGLTAVAQSAGPQLTADKRARARARLPAREPELDLSGLSPEMVEVLEHINMRSANRAGARAVPHTPGADRKPPQAEAESGGSPHRRPGQQRVEQPLRQQTGAEYPGPRIGSDRVPE